MQTFKEFSSSELPDVEHQESIIKEINAKLECIAIPNEEHTKELIIRYMDKILGATMTNKGFFSFWFDNLNIYFNLDMSANVWRIKASRVILFEVCNDAAMEIANKLVNAFKTN